MMKIKIKHISLIFIISLFLAFFIEVYLNVLYENYYFGTLNLSLLYEIFMINYKNILLTFIFLFLIIVLFCIKEVRDFIYRYRYLISLVVFIIAVCFEIHGSSINVYNSFVGSSGLNDINLLGKSRPIRSDEFGVSTPFAFSQYFNEGYRYPYFSTVIRGAETDAFILYGQPVADLAIIFRPFHLGYLFLGPAKGLSFFWVGRFIALFLVTFEMMMILTKKDKILSSCGALLVLFAPVVQWWFAINGLVEMLVFGQLAVILLNLYMNTENYLRRFSYCILIAICLGSFVFSIYPAWQIPMAYFFLILAIWMLISNLKSFHYSSKDILIVAVSILFLVGGAVYILTKSWNTIKLVSNTVYPGDRFINGGNVLRRFFNYPANMFFPVKDITFSNNCEESVFFDFFPINFILAFIVIFKEKKRDLLLTCLLILNGIFILFCTIPLPDFFVKITLLSNCQPERLFTIIGFINIVILFRSLAIMDKGVSRLWSLLLSCGMTIFVVYFTRRSYSDYLSTSSFILISVLLIISFFSMLCFRKKRTYKNIFLVICIVVSFTSGALVNPIAKGTSVIHDNPLAIAISEINEENKGLWIVENLGFPLINYPIMVGAPTINSTNVYPNLERWKLIDPEEKYVDIYNRYAHIKIELKDEGDDEFTLLNPDYFSLSLNINKLKTLNVKNILSPKELSEYNNSEIRFEKMYDEYGFKIFTIHYL